MTPAGENIRTNYLLSPLRPLWRNREPFPALVKGKNKQVKLRRLRNRSHALEVALAKLVKREKQH